jgi:hypothetical protein
MAIALSNNQLYHKTKMIYKKGATCKNKQGNFNLALELREADFSHIGREFHPLRLVW